MPHTSSAKKRLRQSEKRRLANVAVKKTIKYQTKQFSKALEGSNPEEMKEQYRLLVKQMDKAGAKRVIHPNKAARSKSRLAKQLNAKLASPKPQS